MNITKAKYHSDKTGLKDTGVQLCINATIDGVDMFVPTDPSNTHYQAIQEWVAKGNKIEDAD